MLEGIFGAIVPWIIPGIIVLVIIGLIFWIVGIYNRFVSLKNSSEATLGQIRVAMKKRLDMIDQLLGSVKSYAKFEKETLERVTAMRASVATAGPGDLNKVEAESRSIFGRLLAVAENYPDLKTSTTVTSLMDSVKTLEDEIARQRYTFNNISQEFNTMVDTIPSNFVARMMHLVKLEYLQFEDAIKTPPKIEF
ncbi:MAG: LemA family protein [Methanoregula sp.]|jgi:LemA protein|uniref:LemA family protein n=1 Tax=Methanoregula sp. TaxID=2052170 RepID=UPI0025FB09CA|nr:LemA family protein [Methanoregula sp.]MCK9631613.1 LemA family protein [Methanoregula sp.]